MPPSQALFLLGLLVVLGGCANSSSVPPSPTTGTPSPLGPCANNFTAEGGLWTGMRYRTFEEFPKKAPGAAFDALLRTVAASGYQIQSSSKEAGTISASQSISYGQGKTAPLNLVIQPSVPSGIRVEVSFMTSGGVSAPSEGVQKEFCKLLAAVAQSPNEATASNAPALPSDGPPKKRTKKTPAP